MAVSSEALALNISIWLTQWALYHPGILSLMNSLNMIIPTLTRLPF